MTLVACGFWDKYAIQVSDRLITIPKTRKNTTGEWDLHSNKTLVTIGANFWLILGYTGLAYLDEKPTDQFIAETFTGYGDSSGLIAFPWIPDSRHTYKATISRLRIALVEAYGRLPKAARGETTTVIGVGWVQRGADPRRVLFSIELKNNDSKFRSHIKDAVRVKNLQALAFGTFDEKIMKASEARLTALQAMTPEILRDQMMDAVQQNGKISDVVGEDVMGIILDPTRKKVTAHFRCADPATHDELVRGIESYKGEYDDMPSVQTPYFIAPDVAFCPSVGTGGFIAVPSQISFEVSGFQAAPNPRSAYFATYPRKRQPRRGD